MIFNDLAQLLALSSRTRLFSPDICLQMSAIFIYTFLRQFRRSVENHAMVCKDLRRIRQGTPKEMTAIHRLAPITKPIQAVQEPNGGPAVSRLWHRRTSIKSAAPACGAQRAE